MHVRFNLDKMHLLPSARPWRKGQWVLKMNNSGTTLACWYTALVAALNANGHDGEQLLKEVELNPADLTNPEARFPMAKTRFLWQKAVELTGDPCFGLTVSGHINHASYHALGYSVLASSTLKEVFERIVCYFHIVTNGAELKFTEEAEYFCFAIDVPPHGLQPASEALDAFLSSIIRSCRLLTDRNFAPQKVYLKHSKPEGTDGFERFFKAPITYNAEGYILFLDKSRLLARLPTANAELARCNDQIASEYLARHECDKAAYKVKQALIHMLPLGEPSQEAIAKALNMSLRTLQRKLSRENTTYIEILDTTRRALALSYVGQSNTRFSEITFLLGFCDSSSFSRAFKRWTGLSPSQHRTQQHETSA